jgi:hypothetical protein
MDTKRDNIKLAQSASALGAGILGFGLGAKWGNLITEYALIIIVVGAIFHIWGMYIVQLRGVNEKANRIAKVLWISAWVCLVALIAVMIYVML